MMMSADTSCFFDTGENNKSDIHGMNARFIDKDHFVCIKTIIWQQVPEQLQVPERLRVPEQLQAPELQVPELQLPELLPVLSPQLFCNQRPPMTARQQTA